MLLWWAAIAVTKVAAPSTGSPPQTISFGSYASAPANQLNPETSHQSFPTQSLKDPGPLSGLRGPWPAEPTYLSSWSQLTATFPRHETDNLLKSELQA